MGIVEIIIILVAVIGGVIGGFLIDRNLLAKQYREMESTAKLKAETIVKDAKVTAENLHKEKLLEAKTYLQEQKNLLEKETIDRNSKLQAAETRVKQKEQTINQKLEELKKEQKQIESVKEGLAQQSQQLQQKQEELARKLEEAEYLKGQQLAQLEKTAALTQEEARKKLVETITEEARAIANANIKEIVENAKQVANREAKRIVIQSIQRTAAEHAIENTVSVFNLENDEVKGRIIGREGRNIRALEAATGVEIIVDDTPEAIIISGFDPIRREVARVSLHRLVADGRIHPARIEEVVNKTFKQLNEEIIEIGERTAIDLGIHGLHPELIKLVGKMKYRSSYGQNLLQHSREVANLCAIMASELGQNAKLAKRAGLLHDIGKVSEDNPELPHALLGMQLAQKYNEHPDVVNAIGAHHDEIEMTNFISPIVQACDAMSGARPGARREIVETYIKRLKDLEAIATSYHGVSKTYAIQAGREVRVIVEADKVNDEATETLAFNISNQIQSEMQYPGQIKVTVIREKRAVAFAK
jgi:ribonuclease Y